MPVPTLRPIILSQTIPCIYALALAARVTLGRAARARLTSRCCARGSSCGSDGVDADERSPRGLKEVGRMGLSRRLHNVASALLPVQQETAAAPGAAAVDELFAE